MWGPELGWRCVEARVGVRGGACSGQIFISEEACGGPEWGKVVHRARWGSGGGGLYLISHLPYLVSPLCYLVSHLPIWYPTQLSGIPSSYLLCHLSYLVFHPLCGIPPH